MAEAEGGRPPVPPVPPPAPEARGRRRTLPALVRYAIAAGLGSTIAMLASYLLRTIGY